MKKAPFQGILFPGDNYATITAEVRKYQGGTPTPDQQVWAQHLDELRGRVDLSDGPDATVAFTGKGSTPVVVSHSLSVAPRHARLRSFKGLADFEVTAMDAESITLTATDMSTGKIDLWI